MLLKTHIAGGILASELVGLFALHVTEEPIYYFLTVVGSGVIGSVIPDIDHWNSKVSKSNPVGKATSKIVRLFTSHRGAIHTIAFWLIIGVILVLVGLQNLWNGIGLCILCGLLAGVFSHLLLDALNPAGIMLLWPLGRRKMHFAKIKVGSRAETTCGWILYAVDVILFLYIFILLVFR